MHGSERRLWWAAPPLMLTARYFPEAISRDVLAHLERGCPWVLRQAVRRRKLADFSYSHLYIDPIPGIIWARSPGQALRYLGSRDLPEPRAAHADGRGIEDRALVRGAAVAPAIAGCDASCSGCPHVRPGQSPCSRFVLRSREHTDVFITMDALDDTRAAFDSVAADYDGPRGNNALSRTCAGRCGAGSMRASRTQSHLLDLGCGTGLDAVRMAERGHTVLATDWSPRMVERTHGRAASARVGERVSTAVIGAHELARIVGSATFHGVYSNLGPLNCLPGLEPVSRECARLVKPGGRLVFTVIGRWCPWEIACYGSRADWARVRVRFSRGMTPVRMNGHTVWTRYWTPTELYRTFAAHFSLVHCRALCLFAPPPYMTWIKDQQPTWFERLWRWDRRAGGWPLLRSLGDHFLIVMARR